MEYVTYIIVALVPASVAIILAYMFLKRNNEREFAVRQLELNKERQKFFLEPRADAYQRLILLLERIHPNNLIMRLSMANKNATLFQTEILENIRKEFDHNVAQQLFISEGTWDMIKKSKEETIRIVHIAGQQMAPESTSFDLANKIFELLGEIQELPSEIAIKALRKEFQRLL